MNAMLIVTIGMIGVFGLRLLLSGFDSPGKRAELKDYLKGLVHFIICGFLSYSVYVILIGLAGAISSYLLGGPLVVNEQFAIAMWKAMTSESLAGPYSLGAMFAMVTISMQRILLALGAVLLPLAVGLLFMSFSENLRALGQSMLTFFFIIVFLPLVDALVFKSAEFALGVAQSPEYVAVAVFWLVGLLNLLAFKEIFDVSRSGMVAHTIVERVEVVKEKMLGDLHGL